MWSTATLAAGMETSWQANFTRIGGAMIVLVAVAMALLVRGREVTFELGALVITRQAAPLKGSAHQRIPRHRLGPVTVQRVRIDEGPATFARYRHTVSVDCAGRRRPIRIACVRGEDEALCIATRLRAALAD